MFMQAKSLASTKGSSDHHPRCPAHQNRLSCRTVINFAPRARRRSQSHFLFRRDRSAQGGTACRSGQRRFDPNYRRSGYADDFIIGVTGSKSEARQIMEEVRTYLSDHLKLAVREKSPIHGFGWGTISDAVRTMTNPNPHKAIFDGRPAVRRGLADRMKLLVPRDRVVRFVNSKEWGDYDSFRPVGRAALRFASDVEIVLAYNAEWRGFTNYYAIADDVNAEQGRLLHLSQRENHRRKAQDIGSQVLPNCVAVRTSISATRWRHTRTIKLWQLKDLQRHTRTWGGIDILPQRSCSAGQSWSSGSTPANASVAV